MINMVKGIIFDLDMCILNTHSLKETSFQPVLDALYSSGFSDELKEKISSQLWTTSLDDVVDMFDIPEETAEQMKEVYRRIEVPGGIESFGDEDYIRGLSCIKILVTSGYRRFQETKIAKLGIADLFDQIIIDALDSKDTRKGKTKIFRELLEFYQWNVREVLVVGDNPVSELGSARFLGITTVQTVRPTIERWKHADYHIASLSELEGIVLNIH